MTGKALESEKAADDFFAFHSSSSESDSNHDNVNVKKRKKKLKKKGKLGKKSKKPVNDEKSIVASNDNNNEIKSEEAKTIPKEQKLFTINTNDSDLSFLGITEDDLDSYKPKSRLSSPSQNKGEDRPITTTSTGRRTQKRRLVTLDEDNNQDESDDNEHTESLARLNDHLLQTRQLISSFSNSSSNSNSPQMVNFNGTQMSPNEVNFQLDISFISGKFSMEFQVKVKGSSKIFKIIEKSIKHIESQSPLPLDQLGIGNIDSLVFYIPESKLILQNVLKISSLINLIDLRLNDEKDCYTIDLFLMSNEEALTKQLRERSITNSSQLNGPHSGGGHDHDDEIIISFNDLALKSVKTIDIISLEDDEDEVESFASTTSLIPKSGSLTDIKSAFLRLKKYPILLNLTIYVNGSKIEEDNEYVDIDKLGIVQDSIIDIDYDLDELKRLQLEEQENLNENENDSSSDDEQFQVNTKTAENKDNDEDQSTGNATKFTIKLKAQHDKAPVVCTVNSATKLENLKNFYLKKTNRPLTTGLKFSFDDEILDLNSELGELDIEEDDLIDVLIP